MVNYQSKKASTQFWLTQTRLQRCSPTFQQKQRGQQQMLQMHISTRFGAFMNSHDTLSPTVVLNLPPRSTKSLTESSTSTYASQLPTTLRQMDSVNEQSRHSSSTCVSTAMIGKTAGEHGYLLPNLPTIPQLPPPMITLPTEACMASTHAQYNSITTMNSAPLPLKNG